MTTQNRTEELKKETFYSDRMLAKDIGKEISELLLNPKGKWSDVTYRSAIITKLFPLFMRVRSAGEDKAIQETNSKWKQAVQKLLERKFFTNEGSEVVAVSTVKEIFGGLAE